MTSIVGISYEEELKRNPELKPSDIDDLREWCKSQPHLPEISDSELVLFLHSNYYSMEPTKTNIDAYYTLKTQVPDFFANRDPLGNKNLRRMFHMTSAIPLKQLTKEGYHIFLSRIIDPSSANYIFHDSIKYMLMVLELWLYSIGTIKGYVFLVDVQHVTMGHATRISPTGLKKYLTFLQDGLPVRMKGLHFMNVNSAIKVILQAAKPFMKKQLTDILHMHSTLETLEKHMPIQALPNELGGKAGPLSELHEAEVRKVEAHRDWFLDEQSRARVDESKRPNKVKSAKQCSTPAQSFKTIDID